MTGPPVEIIGRGGLMVRRHRFHYVAYQSIGEFRASPQGVGVGFGAAPRAKSDRALFLAWDEIGDIVFGSASFVIRDRSGVGAYFWTLHTSPIERLREMARLSGCRTRFVSWTLLEGFRIQPAPWLGAPKF